MIDGFLVLADSASTDKGSGKVHMLGAGWSLTGPKVPPSAVAGFLRIPWDEVGDQIKFRLRLLTRDREEVRVLDETGQNRAPQFEGILALQQVQPADELSRQIPLNLSFALSIPPLPLLAGRVYQWALDVGGIEVATVDFAVRPESLASDESPDNEARAAE
ncbi:hypothetical protein MF672_030690 [Actinomadura sp. ATCC 31491]|uniref:Uncharacterized protein n=1 Tax=Actinomadura luzonensis TaxID=2805427 RepID=A0ABT0G0H9_9ACTN|nr:hypothetical protein [Actinomadura luzonensis]MCK2218124.1 hypothetical protein [Actinomadura luzonensis]